MDWNPPITNHKPWPFEPVKVKFCFLRRPLRWLTAAKNAIVSWLLNFRIHMFVKSAVTWYTFSHPKLLQVYMLLLYMSSFRQYDLGPIIYYFGKINTEREYPGYVFTLTFGNTSIFFVTCNVLWRHSQKSWKLEAWAATSQLPPVWTMFLTYGRNMLSR